jgi:hypothetical protein
MKVAAISRAAEVEKGLTSSAIALPLYAINHNQMPGCKGMRQKSPLLGDNP